MTFYTLSPRVKTALVLLVYIFVCVILLAPLVLGGKMFGDDDSFLYYYPALISVGEALREGQSFLWNAELYSGFPMYLSQSAGFLDPLNWIIFYFFPTIGGYHLRIAVGLFLGMIAAYAAARSMGSSRFASFLVGLGYPLLFQFAPTLLISNTLFLMPFLLVVVHMWLGDFPTRKKYLFGVAGGVAVGWGLLAGYAQLVFFSVFLALLYFSIRALLAWGSSVPKKVPYYLGGPVVLFGAASILFSLPALLPVLEFIPFTVRSGGLSYTAAMPTETIGVFDYFRFFIPAIVDLPRLVQGITPLFVGVPLFVGAAFALRYFYLQRSFWRHPAYHPVLAAIGCLIFCLIVSLPHSPLFSLLNEVPGFSFFRFPSRWMYLGGVFLALVGAWGVDRMRQNTQEAATVIKTIGVGIFGIWAVLLLPGVLMFLFGSEILSVIRTLGGGMSIKLSQALVDFASTVTVMNPAVIVVLALTAGSIIALHRWVTPSKTTGTPIFVVVMGVVNVIVILWIQWGALSVPVPSMQRPAWLEFVDATHYRIFPAALEQAGGQDMSQSDTDAFQYAGGWPNTGMYYDVPSVDGFDNFVPLFYREALVMLGSSNGARDATAGLEYEERIKRLLENLPLLGMMGGKYIIAGVPLESRALSLIATTSIKGSTGLLYAYENSNALPIHYFATTTQSLPHADFPELATHRSIQWGRVTYLDCTECSVSTTGSAFLTVVQAKNGTYLFTTRTSHPRYLVLSQSYVPGWAAFVNDVPVPLVRANGLYMAVLVPPGEHKVEFEYQGIVGELLLLKGLHIVK